MATVDTLREQIVANRRKHAAEKAKIQTDKNLSEAGRREQLAALTAASEAKHTDLKGQLADTIADERTRLRHRAFGAPTDAAGAMGYRQSVQMAEAAGNGKALRKLLERADLTSDTTLKRAVLAVATERGEWGIVRDSGDDAAAALLEFESAHGHLRSTAGKLGDNMAMSGPS